MSPACHRLLDEGHDPMKEDVPHTQVDGVEQTFYSAYAVAGVAGGPLIKVGAPAVEDETRSA
jgi:hypothetical protein